jgi:hypothetical protein
MVLNVSSQDSVATNVVHTFSSCYDCPDHAIGDA